MAKKSWFQFLYWKEDVFTDPREKIIYCKKLKTAISRFLKWKTEDVLKVDYEVLDASGNYLDISDEKGFERLV